MGMRPVWLFTCDVRGCCSETGIETHQRRSARYLARQEGWDSPDDGVRWFCERHAVLAWRLENSRNRHEEWCPASERAGICACREGPATADRAVGEALASRGWKSRVEAVEVRDDYL